MTDLALAAVIISVIGIHCSHLIASKGIEETTETEVDNDDITVSGDS